MAKGLDRDIRRLEKSLKLYSEVEVKRAKVRALNRSSSKVKSKVVKTVAKDVRLPAKFLRKKVFLRRAKSNSTTALVKSYLTPISVASLLPDSKLASAAPRGTNKKGVRAAGQQFDRAFINRGQKTGRYLVLRRSEKKRYPLRVISIRIDESMSAHQLPISERVLREDFVRVYAHELRFRRTKYGR